MYKSGFSRAVPSEERAIERRDSRRPVWLRMVGFERESVAAPWIHYCCYVDSARRGFLVSLLLSMSVSMLFAPIGVVLSVGGCLSR